MQQYKDKPVLGISGRIAIDMQDGTVAKIPLSKYGITCNREERNNYNALSEGDRKYVAAIISCDGDILYQEKLTDEHILNAKLSNEEIESILLTELDLSKDNIDGLNRIRLHNRLQIGKATDGTYKIFDFECEKVVFEIHGRIDKRTATVELWREYLDYLIAQGKHCTELLFDSWYAQR